MIDSAGAAIGSVAVAADFAEAATVGAAVALYEAGFVGNVSGSVAVIDLTGEID